MRACQRQKCRAALTATAKLPHIAPPAVNPLSRTSLSAAMSILRNRLFQAAISLIIGAFFLWRAIERTQMDEVWRKLHEVDLGWLLTALAAYWLALTLRSWR